MKMTIDEFKSFAPRIVSEDDTRRALTQPCRNGCHAYVSDGRIALVCETCDTSLNTDDETGARSVTIALGGYIVSFNTALTRGDCEVFSLDASRLRIAARATFDDLEPSMDYLRSYEPDPDDPDDIASTESVRFVRERYSRVILPNRGRSVIAGYYADILADVLTLTDIHCAYVQHGVKNSPIYAKGENWYLMVMPLRGTSSFGETRWLEASAIADAATGELVHSYDSDGNGPDRADLDALRFPGKAAPMAKSDIWTRISRQRGHYDTAWAAEWKRVRDELQGCRADRSEVAR